MNGIDRPDPQPFRAIAAVLAAAVLLFGVVVAAGVLEVRRPVEPTPPPPPPEPDAPVPYVQRVKSAESLLDGQHVLWVYRFAGGVPRCWAEIESEGHKQTLGPWDPVNHTGFTGDDPLDRPLPGSVEGYVALFGPIAREQTYRMVCAVTRVKYPENPKQPLRVSGFRDKLQVSLPDLEPALTPPKGQAPPEATTQGYSTLDDGEDVRPVPPGRDEPLNRLDADTPGGKRRDIKLMLRFLSPDEVAAARR